MANPLWDAAANAVQQNTGILGLGQLVQCQSTPLGALQVEIHKTPLGLSQLMQCHILSAMVSAKQPNGPVRC